MSTMTPTLNSNFSLSWGALYQTQPVWFASTFISLLFVFGCLVAEQFDGRLLSGVSVWNKPFKFYLSFVAYFGTLLFFWPLIPERVRTGWQGSIMIWLPVTLAATEMAYITYSAAQGDHSHFNTSSSFHITAYALMGVGAVSLVLHLVWMAWHIARHNPLSDPMIFAIVAGLVLTFLLGGGFGGYMSQFGSHWVQAPATDANGLALFNWTPDGGDLRVAHFFGMHVMQVLPLAALVLTRIWPTKPHTSLAVLIASACAYSAFTIMTFWQATQGQPFIST